MDFVRIFALVGCALLIVAGIAKIRTPAPTSGALRSLGLQSSRRIVRAMGAFEMLLGFVGAWTGARIAMALVAIVYVAFAAFIVVAKRSGTAVQSCGCFGSIDTPPSWIQVIVDLGIAIAATVSSLDGSESLRSIVADEPMYGLPFGVIIATLTFLTVLALTALPRTFVRTSST